LFTGGFAKGILIAKDPDYLERFIRESRRAELCHRMAIYCVPVFFLWNSGWATLVIFVYAVAECECREEGPPGPVLSLPHPLSLALNPV
jgi:hypothetical protein